MLWKLARVWVGLVGIIALANAAQCFINEDHAKSTLYTLRPDEASPLLSRMFGTWTILAGTVRLVFALGPCNKSIWLVTLLSFVLALLHFTSELFIYKTATLSFATISPLLVSSKFLLVSTQVHNECIQVHPSYG
ncbi:hypothetical protein EMCRGX_G032100 [Ephydatia muelleri]